MSEIIYDVDGIVITRLGPTGGTYTYEGPGLPPQEITWDDPRAKRAIGGATGATGVLETAFANGLGPQIYAELVRSLGGSFPRSPYFPEEE